jgi:hypothetical protein
MYYDNNFKRPKAPFVGMGLGSFKSSIEAKLWMKLYLIYGQDMQRSIDIGSHQNDVVAFGCSNLAGLCPFKVRIKKRLGSFWTVLTADLNHCENCGSTCAAMDTQLQVYTNLDILEAREKITPQFLMSKTQALMKSSSSSCAVISSSSSSSSKRASRILKGIIPRKLVFVDEANSPSDAVAVANLTAEEVVVVPPPTTTTTTTPTTTLLTIDDNDVIIGTLIDNFAIITHNDTQNYEHVKPYGWSPIHHWIDKMTYRDSWVAAAANLPITQKLAGKDNPNRTYVLTIDKVPFNILWTEIMQKIFRWSCDDDEDDATVLVSLLHSASSPVVANVVQKYYFPPGHYKHTESVAIVSGLHKFRAVEGERLLRSFVNSYGVSGQSLVRMHTELHCRSYDDNLVYVVINEYPLIWVAANGCCMANPIEFV